MWQIVHQATELGVEGDQDQGDSHAWRNFFQTELYQLGTHSFRM